MFLAQGAGFMLWRQLINWLCASLLVLLLAPQVSSSEVYDDDLSLTNQDAEEYSAAACAKYLCSKYSYETKKFLQDGCEGDFEDYLPSSGVSQGEVTISAALLVVACSFLGAFVLGLFLGKFHKPNLRDGTRIGAGGISRGSKSHGF